MTDEPTPSGAAIVQRLAVAGNVCALVVLAMLAANGDVLFGTAGEESAGMAPPASRPAATADRAVLLVVDGLRVDTASDPKVMPHLSDLARRGGVAVATVESLVPSTVAGIAALSSGRVLAPASFLHDFRSPAAADGGVFAAVRDVGGRSFVAGPRLWIDMYGRWVDRYHVPDGFLVGDESHLVDAARAAVRGGHYRLIVLHLSEPDEVAHRFGGASAEYVRAATRVDVAIGRLASELPPDTCLMVTSDHGVTDDGGHAGPEPEVLRTPLITFGPGAPIGRFGPVRQADVPILLRRALGLSGPSALAVAAPTRGRAPSRRVALALLALLAVWCALGILAAPNGLPAAWRATLCAAPWIVLPLLLLGHDGGALTTAVLVLSAGALQLPSALAARFPRGPFVVLVGTIAFGLVRVCDPFVFGPNVLPTTAPAPAAAVCLLCCGAAGVLCAGSFRTGRRHASRGIMIGGLPPARAWGWVAMLLATVAGSYAAGGAELAMLRSGGVVVGAVTGALLLRSRRRSHDVAQAKPARGRGHFGAMAAGALSGLAHVPLSWLAGQTTSLSSVGVRAGYEVLTLGWGLPVAIVTVAFAQAAIPLGVVIGIGPWLARLGRAPARTFAAGLALGPIGLVTAAGVTLLSGLATPAFQAAAVGSMLRGLSETTYLFLGAVAVLAVIAVFHRPATTCDGPPAD